MQKFLMFTKHLISRTEHLEPSLRNSSFIFLKHNQNSVADSNFHPFHPTEHLSHPGMPMVPRARDNETSSGQFDKRRVRGVPSQTVWVLQPQWATTWVPTGKAALLLWSTLQKKETNKNKLGNNCNQSTAVLWQTGLLSDPRGMVDCVADGFEQTLFWVALETAQNIDIF